jgi:hypothetical protein
VAFALGEETHDLNAVEFGHDEIDGDDVRIYPFQSLKEIVGAGYELGNEAEALSDPLDGLTHGRIVIEDENTSG